MGVIRYLEKWFSSCVSKSGKQVAATGHPLAGSLLLCRKHKVPAMALGPFRLALVDDHNPCIGQGCQYTEASCVDVMEITGWSEQKLLAEVYEMLSEMSGGQLPELGQRIHSYGRQRFGWSCQVPDPQELQEAVAG